MDNLERINNLEVLIDWLGFTFFIYSNPYDVVSYLGLSAGDFAVGNGSNGYKSALRHNFYSITILYDGREDMGIHVNITGSAISYALECYRESIKMPTPFGDYAIEYSDETMMARYLRHISESGKFTRLDLAIDDKGYNYYSVNDVREICDSDRCMNRFRKYRAEYERSFHGTVTGNTLYFGNRQSNAFLRIYDKRLEQIQKTKKDCGFEWVRWELELKKDRANMVVDYLLSSKPLGSVAIGILSNYFRVVVKNNNNITRCDTDPLWERFIENVEKLRLTVSKSEKTLESKKEWIVKQCLPSISAIVAYENGDMSFITNRLHDALWKNKKTILDKVFATNPDLKKEVYS